MGDATVAQYGYGYRYGYGHGSGNGTIKLSPLKPDRSYGGGAGSKLSSAARHSFEGPLRPEKIKNSTTIYSPGDAGKEDRRSSVTSKAGSQEMIIRRDVQFNVSHDYIR